MKYLTSLFILVIFLIGACDAAPIVNQPSTESVSVTGDGQVETEQTEMPTLAVRSLSIPNPGGHPRLWITPSDLPRLQSLAAANNPLWQDGLALIAARAKEDMDQGHVPNDDCGSREYEEYSAEMYAELFAFMSLVEPDAAARNDYAQRARTLLMHVMNAAAEGPADSEDFYCNDWNYYPAYRHPEFFTTDSNRARWHGEAFPLVVDWIYASLSADDKIIIRKVFLRWSEEIVQNGYHHPEPVGVMNDSALLTEQVRWAGNNYYTAHMRNLGMMAMSLDPSDDPNGELRAYLDQATGTWLYIFDQLSRTDSAGGLLPEGMEYSPQTASYAIQFLLALHTAGEADPSVRGMQVSVKDNPFWDDLVISYLHSISPDTTTLLSEPELGSVYQPAFYGDAQHYQLPDFISAFGALGVYDQATGNISRLETLRWIQRETPSGGSLRFLERVGNPNDFRESILYFMLYDPAVSSAADPRPNMPLDFFAPGMNKIFSRTNWGADAAWFNYSLSWNLIDHQQADGNHFEFYRNGEWLTKARIGYADIAEGIASSEFRNLPALQNIRPFDRDDSDWRIDLWQRGSQWNLVASGDPQLLAYSMNDLFVYALGDATNLYNSESESASDILHASRSILWLKPDFIVVYDRTDSKTEGGFKRWWLQLPNSPNINGHQAVMQTVNGQQLFISCLLPDNVELSGVEKTDPHVEDGIARDEPMTTRLKIEAIGAPASVRWLNILQGANAGVTAAATTLIRSEDGFYEGVVIDNSTLALFPAQIGAAQTISYLAPSSVTLHLITGLTPGANYTVKIENTAEGQHVTISPDGDQIADSGGVLLLRR